MSCGSYFCCYKNSNISQNTSPNLPTENQGSSETSDNSSVVENANSSTPEVLSSTQASVNNLSTRLRLSRPPNPRPLASRSISASSIGKESTREQQNAREETESISSSGSDSSDLFPSDPGHSNIHYNPGYVDPTVRYHNPLYVPKAKGRSNS